MESFISYMPVKDKSYDPLKHSKEENLLTDFLDTIKESVTYEKWFFGHYHTDEILLDKHIAIYDSIIKL
ncbi:MAG: hypothetical protein IJ323_01675 [Clostridia bacterium]|nr:hypothetical protein [Clostridia bacterium]